MHLIKKDINADSALRRKAKALYMTAFPKEERVPWWLLRLHSYRQGIDLTAWVDGDVFCGFTASVTVQGLHFVLFFAIDQDLRGKGYGSAILSAIKEAHGTVALNVEPLTEDAPNYEQRKNRFGFYEKNGFVDTGYHVWEVGGMFRVLSTAAELDVPTYQKVFLKLTWGLWKVRVQHAGLEEEAES